MVEFARKGYGDLAVVAEHGWNRRLGVGVIDVQSHRVESPEIVASRIRGALEFLDAGQPVISPDCGLRNLTGDVARAKLAAMVAGSEQVRRSLTAPVAERAPDGGLRSHHDLADRPVLHCVVRGGDLYDVPGSWFHRPPDIRPRVAMTKTVRDVVDVWMQHGAVMREGADLWNILPESRDRWHHLLGVLVRRPPTGGTLRPAWSGPPVALVYRRP